MSMIGMDRLSPPIDTPAGDRQARLRAIELGDEEDDDDEAGPRIPAAEH